MPQEISIRKAIKDDLAMLIAMSVDGDSDYFQKSFEEQELGNRDIYIASLERDDIGYVILNWQPRYKPYQRFNIPEIQDLFISPDYRQQGHASKLIKYCEDTARNEGREEMGISVALHASLGAAHRLYAKLGYIPDGNGATYDRETIICGATHPIDDDLCLMMVKKLT